MKSTIALILLLCTLSSCYFLGPSPSKRLTHAIDRPYDVAIVPGLPFKNGAWDTLVKARILWSVYLYKKGIVKNIIYSGSAVYTPYIEGKSMAIYAQSLGVDPDHIFIDSAAEHSTENLYYGSKIAKAHGFNSIVLATDPFQCYMLNKFAKKNINTLVVFLPIVYDSISTMTHLEPIVDLSPAKVQNFIPLTEREGYGQRIKASRGQRVKQ